MRPFAGAYTVIGRHCPSFQKNASNPLARRLKSGRTLRGSMRPSLWLGAEPVLLTPTSPSGEPNCENVNLPR